MWVKSKKVLHIQNPTTLEKLDFTQEMVDLEIPQECDSNSFFTLYLETEEKPDRPLIQLYKETEAYQKLQEYVDMRRKQIEEIQTMKNDLINRGGIDALEGRKVVVPILPDLFKSKKDKEAKPGRPRKSA